MSNSDPMQRLAQELTTIRKSIDESITNDKVKERAFDQLYQELTQYKEDFLFKAEKPLLLDLLLFYDSLNWFQESLVKKDATPDVIADSFQYLLDEFMELLYRRDVVPFEEVDTFDRKLHKAVKVEPTDDPEKDYKVALVLKRGFNRSDKILRPEEVVIHRLKNASGRTPEE